MSHAHADDQVMWTAPFWDERYGSADRIWSGNPNPQLVAEAGGLAPGRALDAGCGEGADAHWLARRGWQVTAVDVSVVALERGAAHAQPDFADRITWQQADLAGWVPPQESYDLVSAQFMHFPTALREPLFARLAAAVAPGGTLLIVGHHHTDLATTIGRPDEPDMFFTAEQVADTLAPELWDILATDSRPRAVIDPHGQEVTIHDTVLHARKNP
ncbi:MAG TPA: methyltransferase domain-containing protein [Pseudonocardia sp.]|uniref:class I SAM-dependent methyltransferase n=1 Tax=Pseudonocardia sp. TaxID=60912 RepID=UPI002F3E6C48